ncbi:BGTF surface domain-containing protein [Halonotius aquaticus]|nr:BGTF surface domain-containing protein [Halonotius aquaticus]
MDKSYIGDAVGLLAVLIISIVFISVVFTGGVAADSHLGIDEVQWPNELDEGDSLGILVDVSNSRSQDATTDVRLIANGEEQDIIRNATIPAGGTQLSLFWSSVPSRPTEEINPTVEIRGDAESEEIPIRWSEFVVVDGTFSVEPDFSDISETSGTRVNLSATVRNRGTDSDTQRVFLNRTPRDSYEETIQLDGGNQTKIYHNETFLLPGEYTFDAVTQNESVSETVTIPRTGEVSITETSYEDGRLHVGADIENNADQPVTQKIISNVSGVSYKTKSILIDRQSTRRVEFSHVVSDQRRNITVNSTQPDVATEMYSPSPARAEILSVTNNYVRGEEDVLVEYEANNTNPPTSGSGSVAVTDARLIVIDPNGEQFISQDVPLTSPPGSEDTETARITMPTRDDLIDGEYDVRLIVKDANGGTGSDTVRNAFTVADIRRTDETNEFSQDSYRSPAGDFVEVDLTHQSFDEAYILVGGDKEDGEANIQNHLDILHVTGDARFVINTRLVGTNRPSSDVYIPIEGDVTSYAHPSPSGDTDDPITAVDPPQNEFSGVSFVDQNGNQVANTLAEFREQVGITPRGAPLQADRFRLVAGGTGTVMLRDQNIPDLRRPFDRSNIVLTQPELRAVNTYVLPAGSANELDQFEEDQEPLSTEDLGELQSLATESDYISLGDRLLVEVKATGMYGASLDGIANNGVIDENSDDPGNIPADKIAQLNNRREGVEISLDAERYGGANHGGSELQFGGMSDSEIYVLPDDTADQWSTENESLVGDTPTIGGAYFIIDTRGTNPFDNRPKENDILNFEVEYQSPDGERFQYNDYSIANGEQPNPFNPGAVEPEEGIEHYPYFGDRDTTIRANSSFEVLEPTVEYDRTTPDGDLVVPAESDGKVTGFTTIAPGSDVSIQFIESEGPNQELVTIEDVEIEDDRLFTAEADFSQLDPEQRVEVEFYSNGRLVDNRVIDKRGATVVENFESPARFNITSAPESVTVEQRSSLAGINATINNTGSISDRKLVEFRINNETISEDAVFLSAGTNTTRDLSDRFVTLAVGEYPYTISTEDDTATGQLTVTAPESGTDITDSQNVTSGTNPSPVDQSSDPTDTDGGDTDSDPSIFGAIGLRSRDVVAATVITGLAHVLGFWS